PRGFCAGEVRAIEIVERALEKYGPPVYVRHEIVHNKFVVEGLKAKGARFVEDLSEAPADAVTVLSAHGVQKSVEDRAAARRQSAVRELCKLVDLMLVVGAANSSNSNRLREIGSEEGVPSYLIADGSELNAEWLKGVKTVGITAGASAPEVLVDDVISALRRL